MNEKNNKQQMAKPGLVEIITTVGTFLTSLAVLLYKHHANKGHK